MSYSSTDGSYTQPSTSATTDKDAMHHRDNTTPYNNHSNGSAHDGIIKAQENDKPSPRQKVPLRDRINKFGFSWFTCTQSTGGIAILLSETPNQFAGLQTIGVVVYIFNLVLYLIFVTLMLTRWLLGPKGSFKASFLTAPENYFFGSFWLSFATLIIGMQRFAVPHTGDWAIVTIRVLFWIYAACTLLSTIVHLVLIAEYTPIKTIEMSPAWFILIFNAMLTGTVAAAIAGSQPPRQAMAIVIAGVGYQGLGWIASILFLALFVGHMMEKGWPAPNARPGLFMPVGSSGYTIVALIGAARSVPVGYGFFATHPTAPEVVLIVATWVGVFMWVFTFWLFGLALVVCLLSLVHKKDGKWRLQMGFQMSWWAIIFPNVGFTLATIYLSQELESTAISWVASAMTILLVIFWLMDLALMGKFVVLQQLRMGKEE